ncbi:DUF4344 domain-containing metallopeptidase [uncultured Devosia sp.]|uniref:DUF4344 domain-containing metallopeptidase n=1 Tax=uncultured Devosia sp. TaxID=211434 RepID=UPI0035CA0A55
MRRCSIGLILIVVAMVAAMSGVADAKETSKAERTAMRRFAANNSLFVLYHEMGHLLVHQLDLPVLGKEEDAADNVATWTLLRKGTPEADQTLADAAQGWLLTGLRYGTDFVDEDFYGNHSLDRQRAFQIVCLMVGSNDTAFRPIANQYAIDRDRQDSCADDYHTVNRSMEGLLGARSSKNGGPSVVNVTYHDATGDLKSAAVAFRASGVFDAVADEIRTHYSLPQPIAFNAQRCGEANAFYDPETVEVIFCYELMQDFMDLYAADSPTETISIAPRPTGTGKTKTAPMSNGTMVSPKNIEN